MKKTLLLILASVLLISFSAFAGGGGAGKDEITIAMIVKNIGNPFFDVVRKGWDEAVAELGPDVALEPLRAEGVLDARGHPRAERLSSLTEGWGLRAWVHEARSADDDQE